MVTQFDNTSSEANQPAASRLSDDFPRLPPSRTSTVITAVTCFPLAIAFALLGCFLIACGLEMSLAVFFIHSAPAALAVCMLLGFVSLVAASALCAVPVLFIGVRRQSNSAFVAQRRFWPDATGGPFVEARLHVLAPQEGCERGLIYSGIQATVRHHEVDDEVMLVLVGVSQLAGGQGGTARLYFANPARHQAYLREGLEFEILHRQGHPACRGSVARVLDERPTPPCTLPSTRASIP